MSDTISKSWFCVFNNPVEHGYTGEAEEVAKRIVNEWCDGNPSRTCAVAFCISAEGLHHLHCVFEDKKTMRFSMIKKTFPEMHIEATKGNRDQAEDYINKRGKWEEKGEKIICIERHGEISGVKGHRSDLDEIEALIDDGYTPKQIMAMSFRYRKYEKMIKDAFFAKREKETPVQRKITTYWHVGESGTGKSYTYVQLCEKYGQENVYMLTDCESGGFDLYCAETYLIIDEFRGQIKYSVLLNSILSNYKTQVHSRYANIVPLWVEVHITSVFPPEDVYRKMVEEYRHIDTFEQLRRRIDFVVYHWKTSNGNYCEFQIPMSEYKNYEDLKRRAESGDYDVYF
ncbi:MAG TPA: hypothetical protein PK629_05070 [Oscillospiraceae bacterium]|nr:hypothetical protein [Oscillospiraceae bacterium]